MLRCSYYFQRFVDVQFAGFSVAIDASVIVNAVGEVGIFLDFAQNHVRPDGVGRSRGNEKSVARPYEMGLEDILQPVLLQCRKEFLLVRSGLQARKQARARLRGNRVPHLGFSSAAGGLLVSRGISVVRMHLDGEFVLREDEFHENGEFLAGGQPTTTPVRRHCTPGFAQGFSGERAGGDFAIETGEPGLAQRLG